MADAKQTNIPSRRTCGELDVTMPPGRSKQRSGPGRRSSRRSDGRAGGSGTRAGSSTASSPTRRRPAGEPWHPPSQAIERGPTIVRARTNLTHARYS